MAVPLAPTLIDSDFKHWLKGALAALFTRQGLRDFVENVITDYQKDLLKDVCILNNIPAGTTCNSCTTANVLLCPTPGFCSKDKKCNLHDPQTPSSKPNKQCPHGLCTALRDAICDQHRYSKPSWKNTDTKRWCTDSYQIAKTYMPEDGYSDQTSFARTDLNGLIAVIINNKRFEYKMTTNFTNESNICEEARKADQKIRQTPTHQLSEQELVSYIDAFIQLLSDSKYLATDSKAVDAVDKLKELKTNTLTVYANDITNVLNDYVKEKFDDRQRDLVNEIDKHFQAHEKDSVNIIDRKVNEFVDLENKHLDKFKSQTEKGIIQPDSQNKKRKIEVIEQTRTGKAELELQIKKGKQELQAQTEEGKVAFSEQCDKEIYEPHAQAEKSKKELNAKSKQIEHDLNAKSTEIYSRTVNKVAEEIRKQTNTGKQELEAHGKQVCEEINRSALLITGDRGDILLQDLKEDLISCYLEDESMIPASPLVDEHTVPLEKLFVLPPLRVYENPYNFEAGQTRQITISELFLDGDNVRYKKIYITANAGFGKTSLSQWLTMSWCQSHIPLTSLQKKLQDQELEKKFKDEELDALKYFDFLFMLHLRDYQSEAKCNLDDLIMKMLSDHLSRNTLYTKEFLQRVLHEKKCLIILDGLDEWFHPGQCERKPEVPHNNHPDSCTVLTTTRDWKIGTIGLSRNYIDRRVEISMLDDTTLNQLATNAIQILNENKQNLAGKTLCDFAVELFSIEIGDIISIPYILLQLICLFFGGLPIGKSSCEIYSNITEFTLERGLHKKNLPNVHEQPNGCATTPNCMKENESCNRYFNVILKLGKLACFTLFGEKKESSLSFERRLVTQYLTEHEIEFCLKVGLLCQTKDSSIIATKRYTIFFQHKSVQEFFCAIYLTFEWTNDAVKYSILNACSSLLSILEMSNIFLFVSGMNPEVYTSISGELQKCVERDVYTCRYRTDTGGYGLRTMHAYQTMQVQCFEESLRNGHERCSVYLPDIVLAYDVPELTVLKTILNFNTGNVKSLDLTAWEPPLQAFIRSLDPGVFSSLESLRVKDREEEQEWLPNILTESARTLKSLTLSGSILRYMFLPDISITPLIGLTDLNSIDLSTVTTTHRDLERLYAYISQTTTMTMLRLGFVDCSDHKGHCLDCAVALNLHLLNKLKMLRLCYIPCKQLQVNTSCLEDLDFTLKPQTLTARSSASLWEDLRGAPVLSTLLLNNIPFCQEMIEIISTLTQIENIEFEKMDICDEILRFSPAMTKLKHVKLKEVTISSAARMELFPQIRYMSLPEKPLIALADLQSIDLLTVTTSHSDLERLYAYLSQTTTLTMVKLGFLDCSDHKKHHPDCVVVLDLRRLNKLQRLHLDKVPCRQLQVNAECLKKLDFSQELKLTTCSIASLWEDLRGAPVLSTLLLNNIPFCQEMIEIIPTLTQIENIEFEKIDICDEILRFSPEMTKLKHVDLKEVTISSASCKELLHSVGQRTRIVTIKFSKITMTFQEWRDILLSVGGLSKYVTVVLNECKGPSKKEWKTIADVIKSTPNLLLLQDLSFGWSNDVKASLTLTTRAAL